MFDKHISNRIFKSLVLKYINLSNKIFFNISIGFVAIFFSYLSNVILVPDIQSIYSQIKKVGPKTAFDQQQSYIIIP